VTGERHAPAALPPVKSSGVHCSGGWMGPGAGLDGCGEEKMCLRWVWNPRPSGPQRVAIPITLSHALFEIRNTLNEVAHHVV
jgi:hypothetical protein